MPIKRITKKCFDNLKPAEQEMLLSLGLEIEDEMMMDKPKRRVSDSLLERYACIVETTCKLCKSTTTAVFSMEGVGGLLVSQQASLDQIEGMTVKTRTETVLTCPLCHDYLASLCKEDLISLAIKAAKGDCRLAEKKR